MKNFYYIILFLFILITACKKKHVAEQDVFLVSDSLTSYLSLANDYNLAKQKRQSYNQKAFAIIINQPNDSMHRVNLFRVANRYFNIANWKGYEEAVRLVLKKSETSKDTVSIAKAFTYLGDYFVAQAASDSAFLYYFKAEKMYLQRNDNYNLAKTRLNKATLQYNESDFLGGQIAVFKALSAIKGGKNNDILYDSYNLLGLINNELGEYNKAIEYHNKALSSIDDKTSPVEFQYRAASLNNLGLVYQNVNNQNKAIPYFEDGLQHKKDLLLYRPLVYAMLLDNLGYSRYKNKMSKGLPELLYKSLKLRDSLQFTTGIILSNVHLSEYFASKGDMSKALQYSKAALTTARNSKNNRNLLLPLKQMAVIEPQNATLYNKEYIHINDSLQKAERNMGDKFTRIEYETDKFKQENTDLTTQNRNLVYIFGSLLILGMFLYIIKAQKAKNRELLYKQEQQRANEEIYNLMISQQNNVETIRVIEKKRVAQELHDGVLGRMFGVRMNLDSLNKTNSELASEQRDSYIVELKNIEQDIREISHDLNREKSELINNFVAIVDNLFEDQKKTFEPQLVSSIDSSIKWDLISNAVKINLYRVIQESLQNANKYAEASLIKVEFKKGLDALFLHISDNGKGFNVKKSKKGIGIQNMHSRVNECEGTFEVQSKKGVGTTIRVTIPT